MTTVDALNDRWNALRAAIVGRGTAPLVPALADQVEQELVQWRQFRASAGRLLDDVRASELNAWVDRYNRLQRRYAETTGKPPSPAPQATTVQQQAAESVAEVATPLAHAILAAGVGVGILSIVLSRRGR